MSSSALKNMLFIITLAIYAGCYTVIKPPTNYSSYDLEDQVLEDEIVESIDDDSVGYTIINNYTYSYDRTCLSHGLCHSNSGCHSHIQNGSHCNITFNWWLGGYTCTSYYCSSHSHHHIGHHHGHWGSHHSHWWGHGYGHGHGYWADTGGSDSGIHIESSDNVVRDRSFVRENSQGSSTHSEHESIVLSDLNSVIAVSERVSGTASDTNKNDKPKKKKSKKKNSGKKKNKVNIFSSILFGSDSKSSSKSVTQNKSSLLSKIFDVKKSKKKSKGKKKNRKNSKSRGRK